MNCPPAPLVFATLLVLAHVLPAAAATREVGPGKPYATPCAAIAAAADGDVVQIAAGTYSGDVCTISRNNLTLRGVGARAHVAAAGMNAAGKGTWVITGSNTTVENIEFSGATVPDQNGAGIRQEGANLTVRDCYFHDNENGILANPHPTSEILIERSEFYNNGYGMSGYTHNVYIGHVKKLTFRFNHSHHVKVLSDVGHLLKSRAAENHILYNRLTDEADGMSSRAIDIPNAGTTYIIGNIIHQSALASNGNIVLYGGEGADPANPGTDLYVVNNTFVNDRAAGGSFILVAPFVTTPAVVINNLFVGTGTLVDQATALKRGNLSTTTPQFRDRANFDWNLLPDSPAVNAGVDPGKASSGLPLAPLFQYRAPTQSEARLVLGALDVGAYELAPDGGAGGVNPDAGQPDAGSSLDAGQSGAGNQVGGGAPTLDGGVGAAPGGSTPGDDRDGSSHVGCGCGASSPLGGALMMLFVVWSLSRKK